MSVREVDELADYYPDVRIAASESGFDVLTARAGMFRDLPYRARLYVEVPMFRLGRVSTGVVPPLRSWAVWDAGPEAGMPLTTHHQFPDGSMCVCMREEWVRGRDVVVDYFGYCVCWIANLLHDSVVGFYPGTQHLPEHLRVKRDRPLEYCGCGGRRRYRDCHRKADRRIDTASLARQEALSRTQYLEHLRHEGRALNPLAALRIPVVPQPASTLS